MTHRSKAPLPIFQFVSRFARPAGFVRRPSKLTLGTAATIAAAVAGIVAGVTAGGSPTPGGADALNRAGVAQLQHDGSSSSSAAPESLRGGQQADRAAADRPSAPSRRARPVHAGALNSGTLVTGTTKPYLMYDSVTPSALPASHAIATYATGPFAVSPSQLAGRGPVLWIDTMGVDPAAGALDVEPGDATPSQAGTWAQQRLSAHPHALAVIYTTIGEWSACQAAVSALPRPMQSRVRWWIADPTGSPHLVPGSDATQWDWGQSVDISTATPRF